MRIFFAGTLVLDALFLATVFGALKPRIAAADAATRWPRHQSCTLAVQLE